MRKKIVVLLTFVFVMAAALGIMAGCDKEEVTVSISKTTLTLETGKSSTLSATASDGSEIVWTTSSEEVASVTDGGKVTGVSAGTAKVTATVKDGKASASCDVTVKQAVTVTFEKSDGTAVTEAEVDIDKGPLQLAATASDGGAVIEWISANENIATVSSAGLVTGVQEGETTITARTANATGTLKVTVIDTFSGVKYTLTDAGEGEKQAGEWWYYIALDGARQTKVVNIAEFRADVITFDFRADNWYANDVQLGLLNSEDVEGGWKNLTGKINSNVAGTVTILGTAVELKAGDTVFSVSYNQDENDNEFYMAFDYPGKGFITEAKVVVSDLVWSEHNIPKLETPSFALNGDAISITDGNTEGVENYQIGLFKTADDATPEFGQFFTKAGGNLNVATLKGTGDYIVRIRALGKNGFENSDWSEGADVTYNVNNESINYELNNTGADYATANPGTWTFWAGDGGEVADKPVYDDGSITMNCKLGWAFYSVQMFYRSSVFVTGDNIKVTMKINSTAAGYMTISGQIVKINEGLNNIEIYLTQGAGETLSMQFGVVDKVNTPDAPVEGYFPAYTADPLTFVISDLVITEAPAETPAE